MQQRGQADPHPNPDQTIQRVEVLLGWSRTSASCFVHVLNIERDVLNVAAAIMVAFFTGTLWWTTEKLWKADQTRQDAEIERRKIEAAQRTEDVSRLERSLQIAGDSANAASQQALLARQTLIIGQRPWLSVEPFPGAEYIAGGQPGDRSGQVIVGMRVKNHGRSPANNIVFEVRFVDMTELALDRALFDVTNAVTILSGAATGITIMPIFPGGTEVAARNANKPVGPGKGEYVQGYVVGCVGYQFPFGGEIGRTTFCCTISKKDGGKLLFGESGTYAIDVTDNTISADRVVFTRWVRGNTAT